MTKKQNFSEHQTFETPVRLDAWLAFNNEIACELWVRIFKKKSDQPSVTWNDCVVAAITWGWIDSQRKSLDDLSFLQRLTPRRKNSNWSKKNCDHAESLIKKGLMQPSGLIHIQDAKADGRWDRAYSGSADMVLHGDFLEVLSSSSDAKLFFSTLGRSSLYSIYHSIQTANGIETRKKRIAHIVTQLAAGTFTR
jgi:uncharacterized protein YdeI (YjbR/CyaY-like superfamily)